MNSPEIQAFIKEQSDLFWHIPEKDKPNISHEVLVEYILNYGDMDALKNLFKTLGLKNVASIFYKIINTSERRKGNFHELTLHYFTLFFTKHAPEYFKP